MMHDNPFSGAELARRLQAFRAELSAHDLDGAVVAAPENVFYLTGLDHWGYFAPHLLIVARDREPVLVTRAMEKVSIDKQVRNAVFRGHSDSETAADMAARTLRDLGLAGKRLGLECWTAGLSHGLGQALRAQVEAEWTDISGILDDQRLVKSAEEQALMRRAAAISDQAATAAIEAIGEGVPETEVAATCIAAMTRAGGSPPAFGPFIRPGSRLEEEHTTWGDGRYKKGEPVFLELSGCRSRYHAPLGRLVHIGAIPDADAKMAETTQCAFDAVLKALQPGAKARDVYAAWQAVVDDAGLAHYRRHHCGYCVGIGQAPSWTGGNKVTGLRRDSELPIRAGMSFHILSWLMGTGKGDYFLSNTVLLGPDGAEVLTRTPTGPIVK
ncbi:M24 family metallopeptidase [Dongia sp.]|uniref:M24 family metallopeptidase n=1 Tax=Dongia sp. TaxID=1977262 RepID=UPI003753707B